MIISLLIITKIAENFKLLWFEIWQTSFPWFYFILLFYLIPQQILKFFLRCTLLRWKFIKFCSQYVQVLCALFIFTSWFEINCIKIQTMNVVLNLFWPDSLSFICLDIIIRQWLKKKFKLVELFSVKRMK